LQEQNLSSGTQLLQFNMSDDSLKKLNRIVAILTHLQSSRVVKAQELADRFDVSLRTIYRDIRTLEDSGVPVVGEAGTGYTIMEGYRLPPVMFTREEAGSFITAEKLMKKLTDENLGNHYESAMFKIKSVMRAADKDWLDNLENSISVHPNRVLFNKDVPNALEIILEAIADKRQVILHYKTQFKEPSERHIEPIGIFHASNFWYFTGYCTLRNDYRQFRTDRILGIKKSDKGFTKTHPTLEELRARETDLPVTKVRIAVDKKLATYMGNTKYEYGFVSQEETDDKVIMTFMTHYLNYGFERWYMMYADQSEVLEPQELKDAVHQLLQKIQDKMQTAQVK